MSKSQVLADIQAKIKTNGNQEITGDVLQGVLTESVNLVPENVSDLTNDANYQTATQVDAKVKVVSDEVANVKAAQTSQATDITNLQSGLSTASSSIQEVDTKVATKADQSEVTELSGKVTKNTADLDSKVDKTGFSLQSDSDFIAKSDTETGVELFKINEYSTTNASQVSASVAVKGIDIYPLNKDVKDWDSLSGFEIQVNSGSLPQLRFAGLDSSFPQLAVNSKDMGSAVLPLVLVRRGIGFCDYNDSATGDNFMQGLGSFNLLNTDGAFSLYYRDLLDPETGDYEEGPFDDYRVLWLTPCLRKYDSGVRPYSELVIEGDMIARIFDDSIDDYREYRLSQIGDIQEALQTILGN